MFVNFNEIFNKEPQNNFNIPDSMLDYLNEQLPKGVKYRVDEYGNCQIITEKESINIGGFIFVPSKEHKKIIGEQYSYDDILRYSYNSQKPIPLKLKKEGFITINGQEVSIDRLNYNPFKPLNIHLDKAYMYPQKFPGEFTLNIGCDKYSVNLKVKRVPNESINIAAYESEINHPLFFKYYLDEDKNTISFSISYNLKHAKTIRDIVEATAIYNAYTEGRGLIAGNLIVPDIDNPPAKKYDAKSLLFWEKVLEIEQLVNVHFTPPEEVNYGEMRLVETLYQNLVNKVPIRNDRKIDSIEGEWNMKSEQDVKGTIGQSIFFEFQATSHIDLFEESFELPCLVGIFQSKLRDYSLTGTNYKLMLEDLSDENKMYTSELCFITDNDMKEYIEQKGNDRITDFQEAKNVHFYENMV